MKKILKEVASVQVGYSFRARLEPDGAAGIGVIQMKDLTENNRIDCGGIMRVAPAKIKEHHLVEPGDLIFRSRGLVNHSAILTENPGKTVVAAPLMRIRVTSEILLPEFLNWIINQASAQSYLASHARGTAQQMISKEALENMEIELPPLDHQKRMVDLAALAEEEQKLLRCIAEKRRQYVAALLMQSLEGE